MEATGMRRSTLQRKDRSELNQIAAALGARPSSRARKDEVIQLIIDLTSGEAQPAASSDTDPTHSRDAQPASAGGAGDEARQVNARNGSGGDDSSAGGDEQPATERNDRADDDTEPGNRRRRRRSRDRDRDREDGWDGDPVAVQGRLDLRDEGYGFLRVEGGLPSRNDAYVPVKTIRQYGLRRGDELTGTSRPANRTEKNPALLTLETVNGAEAELTDRPRFEDLTPIHAVRRLSLERSDGTDPLTGRLIDLVAPIGVGQRVLVKGPRRSGASEVLASIVSSIEANEPDIYIIGLFIDQRPEDITELRRLIRNGEVAATSFDQAPEDHVQTAEMAVERAKRLVEAGRDVAVVLDGITALARAYNSALSNAGRAYTGNVESGAVHMPKKLFGAGRNISEGGSLTMIASITTPDPTGGADPVLAAVSGEFCGAANTELCLDQWAAELGVFPAVDVAASVSRDERRFLDADEVEALTRVRSGWAEAGGEGPGAGVKTLEAALARIHETASNADVRA